jgi:hypothetical protein
MAVIVHTQKGKWFSVNGSLIDKLEPFGPLKYTWPDGKVLRGPSDLNWWDTKHQRVVRAKRELEEALEELENL